MNILDRVRIKSTDEFMATREGRIHGFAMDKDFNIGWIVNLDDGEGGAFFLESDLELIDPINNII